MKICPACKAPKPDSGPLPCLTNLDTEDIERANCGGGHRMFCFIEFKDGRVIRGSEAFDKLIDWGGNPALLTGPKLDINNLPAEMPERWIDT